MTSEKKDKRRQYSAAMKAQVVAECGEPGASVAKVAMAHGINANVVHRWRQLAREGKVATPVDFHLANLGRHPPTTSCCARERGVLRHVRTEVASVIDVF